VVITTALYYELYVGGSVASLQLATLHMSFSFYVLLLAFGNLIGAFGSLLAGLADRIGRCNLVVAGLLLTGILVAFVIPEAGTRWAFGIEYFAVGLVEGICLVATPALIRDFSPQVGRGSAMAFWTMGPVLGSLVVAIVGSSTINAHTTWPHEYRICGVVGLVVFVVAAVFLRELSPGIRDQLMVSQRDRALIEARAKGIDIESSLRHPFRQLLKPDVVISAIGVSVLLVSYYTAVAFGTIFYSTVFGFSLNQANDLGDWNWSINIAALLLAGVLSDRLRVRKPFMVLGGVWGAIATVLFLSAIGHHETYSHMVVLTALVSFGLGLAYVSWMASFTESVEARNPALTATGLAIWGLILRVIVFGLFIVLPLIVHAVNPLVDYGTKVQTLAAQYGQPLAFAKAHPTVVAEATANQAQLAQLSQVAPELAVVSKNPVLFTKLAAYSNPAAIPPALLKQGIAAAGGTQNFTAIAANKAAIASAAAFATKNPKVVADATQYSAQLKSLAAIPSADLQYLNAHGAAVTKAAAENGHEWQHWYWVAFGGVIVFLLCIPLLKGRWRPSQAKADEQAHEAMVAAEMAKLEA
jgi:ACS family D-galactonate transporter-like MFS transporter